jgi:DNA-binding transcriptional LysR family regulator
VAGTITINFTTFMGGLPVEAIDRICQTYSDIRIRIPCSESLVPLETANAQVSVRFGAQTQNPDDMVQELCMLETARYASPTYIAHHGILKTAADYSKHFFAGPLKDHFSAPAIQWLRATVPSDCILLDCTGPEIVAQAVYNGPTICALPTQTVPNHTGMVEVVHSRCE